MKIIVTHASPDLDAITSVWLIKKFLPGWQGAGIKFVSAGSRFIPLDKNNKDVIETMGTDEIIHVDTGLGMLDHHQVNNSDICASSLTWDFLKNEIAKSNPQFIKEDKWRHKNEALTRITTVVTKIDNFKEVYWPDPLADYFELSLLSIIDGLKFEKQGQDIYFIDFISNCLDAILHNFENRIWAEQEIKDKGKEFITKYGKALGIETINDSVIKLAQKMGYVIVVRKDPRKGYVRIKALPKKDKLDIDLTLAFEKLSKIDPDATWFLHVSKKMLLNGTPKNPKMKPTKLPLDDIMETLKTI